MMNRRYCFLWFAFVFFNVVGAKAQVYVAKVSKDSVAVLKGRLEVLKTTQELQELKIKESVLELEIEKLRESLVEANDKAKDATEKSNKHLKKLGSGTIDAKDTDRLAKKARKAMEESQKALDRYNKEIRAVDKLREEIKLMEQKESLKKPAIVFSYR